jgi:hypothetical protein
VEISSRFYRFSPFIPSPIPLPIKEGVRRIWVIERTSVGMQCSRFHYAKFTWKRDIQQSWHMLLIAANESDGRFSFIHRPLNGMNNEQRY